MSDYFGSVERDLRAAVRRRAHLPWYLRVRARHGRALAIVIAALMIATPAVGAVSGWFSAGKPNRSHWRMSPTAGMGDAIPGTARLLPIRFRDPDGGPPWGLRLVRTTRGETCLQLGRVQNGQLGTLGIDHTWHNDHEFHPIPANDNRYTYCGSTDAAGHGFLNFADRGQDASAAGDPHCLPAGVQTRSKQPSCPAGSGRLVFLGLLGPDATSITYRKPGGAHATERTAGGVGAYLLVFRRTSATCYEYTHSAFSGGGTCDALGGMGVSPRAPGAVTKIAYRDGHSCSVDPPARLVAALRDFNARFKALPHPKTLQARHAQYARAYAQFLRSRHMTAQQLASEIRASCPPVGWVKASAGRVTEAQIRSPLNLKVRTATHFCGSPTGRPRWLIPCDHGVPAGYVLDPQVKGPNPFPREVLIDLSFTARRAVTSSGSWYAVAITRPRGGGCDGGGTGGPFEQDFRSGQLVRYQTVEGYCHGTYQVVVTYMPHAGPGVPQAGPRPPGMPGSLIVARRSFTIR